MVETAHASYTSQNELFNKIFPTRVKSPFRGKLQDQISSLNSMLKVDTMEEAIIKTNLSLCLARVVQYKFLLEHEALRKNDKVKMVSTCFVILY